MYYKVKSDRQIQVGGIPYLAGQIVNLTDEQAAYHADNIEPTSLPFEDDAVAHLNFVWNKNSDFAAEIFESDYVLNIATWGISGATVTINTIEPHCLSSGKKINVFATEGTGTNEHVAIDGNFVATVVDADTLTIPLTLNCVPDDGFIDIPANLTGVTYSAKLYNPASTVLEHTESSRASTVAGSRSVELSEPLRGLYAGKRLTVEGILADVLIKAQGDRNLIVATAAQSTAEDKAWWATENDLDFDSIGTEITNFGLSINVDAARLSLTLPAQNLSAGAYPYRITRIVGGLSTLSHKGWVVVK
jgi:hypothetical protein